MRRIVCRVGDKYSEEDALALNPDVIYRGELANLPGVWNKLAMLLLEGPFFYIDLDSVVRGELPEFSGSFKVGLDYFAKYREPDLFDLNTYYNSSVMYWEEPQTEIWERFMKSPDLFMRKYKGIDRFLWWECRDLVDTFEDGLYEVHGKPVEDSRPILTFSGTSVEDSVYRRTLESARHTE